eukprot:TRINITY_DN5133_c0_g1_i1.p1 TRINITY_DN5133_c0_g1~~TRINITY_DN5133_c0_g1_i1.p1  ORF type:complete len:104 (+),score=22.73 TRINITY_DN5133_c0_g1_i1:379-690(+)
MIEEATAFAQAILQYNLAPKTIIEDESFHVIGSFVVNRYESIILDLACMFPCTLPVSYTHLTLPTILLVQISVAAASIKKKKKKTKTTIMPTTNTRIHTTTCS